MERELKVKLTTGRVIQLQEVDSSMTVRQLMDRVSVQEGFDSNTLSFVVKGKQLNPELLAFDIIKPEDVINVIINPNGG
jgi:hypothetical protein